MTEGYIMAERTLKIDAAELRTVRLVCRTERCGAVVESPLAHLAKSASLKCPVCGEEFRRPGPDAALTKLAEAVGYLAQSNLPFELQFVLPLEPPRR